MSCRHAHSSLFFIFILFISYYLFPPFLYTVEIMTVGENHTRKRCYKYRSTWPRLSEVFAHIFSSLHPFVFFVLLLFLFLFSGVEEVEIEMEELGKTLFLGFFFSFRPGRSCIQE